VKSWVMQLLQKALRFLLGAKPFHVKGGIFEGNNYIVANENPDFFKKTNKMTN
jgi:hypothetical protein